MVGSCAAGEAAPRAHLPTDADFVPSMSGVSSTHEVDKNKRATKHKTVRADLRRSGELA